MTSLSSAVCFVNLASADAGLSCPHQHCQLSYSLSDRMDSMASDSPSGVRMVLCYHWLKSKSSSRCKSKCLSTPNAKPRHMITESHCFCDAPAVGRFSTELDSCWTSTSCTRLLSTSPGNNIFNNRMISLSSAVWFFNSASANAGLSCPHWDCHLSYYPFCQTVSACSLECMELCCMHLGGHALTF